MPKRRRERDRPKAGPGDLYNPNKRVLLSYDSDEEVQDAAQQEAPPIKARASPPVDAAADYKIEEYPADDEEDEHNPGQTLDQQVSEVQHKATGLDDELIDGAEAGVAKGYEPAWSRSSQRNAATGQRPALGSLAYELEDGDEDEDGYDSTEEEAMAYLKFVRSERQDMPEVLRAHPSTDEDEDIYSSGLGDSRGFLSDGAYVSRPTLGPSIPDTEKTHLSPQEAFTTALKDRFLKQRAQLHLSPGVDALAALDDNHPISFPAGNNKAYAEWHRLLRTSVPLPAQVRSFDQETVFGLLAVVQKHYLQREKVVSSATSAWIWSLLARLDEVGTMNNDRVSAVREFGKKAILVQVSFSSADAAEQLERAAAAEAYGSTGAATFDKQAAAAAAVDQESDIAATSDTVDTQNTLATLDSIIVLVGELFGQRDLLEFRQPWEQAISSNAAES